MKERGILFSAPMVRALLDGSKTQTRRALRVQPLDVITMEGDKAGREWVGLMTRDPEPHGAVFRCKYGVPGDRLWVRESFYHWRGSESGKTAVYVDGAWKDCVSGFETKIDMNYFFGTKTPSIHMPRWASRILLEIVSVRVERLNDCSGEDARAEGVLFDHMGWMDYAHNDGRRKSSSRQSYQTLWESLNGAGSWAANPWVWVIEFKRVQP